MDIKITPHRLFGEVNIPSSKSLTHRALICAALAKGTSIISGVSFSKDIDATLSALANLGAKFDINNSDITVTGIENATEYANVDCCESGSTLRFIIPIISALGTSSTLFGEGRLPERPITPYLRELSAKGVNFKYEYTMPFSIDGQLKSGEFNIEGDISSQFITGLLFALPLLDGDSKITMMSPLQSKPYVDMSIDCMKDFGIEITETDYGYFIKGNQQYQPKNLTLEGDYSQGAFFFVANAIGNDIKINNLSDNSLQGDKKIVEILREIGYNNNNADLNNFYVDATDIPDLVPILAVLGCFCNGTSKIIGAERLKIKESDRLEATSNALNALGGKITATNDGLIIEPIDSFKGGIVDSFGDHRIVMCIAICATRSQNEITILNADAVEKSYPAFFEHYNKLGGTANVINLE